MANVITQNLPFIPEWLARKLDQWIAKKSRNPSNVFDITRHNIYILPSKAGWLYIITLIAILSGAINYNNNMAYLLCFFLASLGFIAMLQTHQNISGIIIKAAHSPAVYCGKLITFNFIATTKNHHHFAIQTSNNNQEFSLNKNIKTDFSIKEPAKTRGRTSPHRFKIYSEFPLGLFHAWTQVEINNPVIVYPKAIKDHVIASATSAGNKTQEDSLGDDNYAGIRRFIKGDNPKRMAWKAIAKTNILYSKEFHTEADDFLLFDYDKLNHINKLEEKLSVLCGLILNASKENKNYGLKLPKQSIKPSHGERHKHQCLALLALYKT